MPKVHKENSNIEVERLILVLVPEILNDSEWGFPYFAQHQPKKN